MAILSPARMKIYHQVHGMAVATGLPPVGREEGRPVRLVTFREGRPVIADMLTPLVSQALQVWATNGDFYVSDIRNDEQTTREIRRGVIAHPKAIELADDRTFRLKYERQREKLVRVIQESRVVAEPVSDLEWMSTIALENGRLASRTSGWFRQVRAAGTSVGNPVRRNPGRESDFDPREWQVHAQTNAIYEANLCRMAEVRSFRTEDREQRRLDADMFVMMDDKRMVLSMIQDAVRSAFAVTTARGQKYQFFVPGTRTPTERTAEASRQRYHGDYLGSDGRRRTLDDLVNTRQSYEEMLGLARQGNSFYRMTEEPTASGPKWFVWPMVPGQRIPGPAGSQAEAEKLVAAFNRSKDPRDTNQWHVPQCAYTRAELAHWLPPDRVFRSK